MKFDLDAARKAGKTDDEIASYLGQSLGFDVDAAKKAGRSSSEIAEYLATHERPSEPRGVTGSWDDKPSFTDELPELAGGVVGGLLASARKSPMGMAIAGIGGAGGEAWKQVYQQATGSPNAPQTPGEAAKRIAVAGGTQAVGEGFGRMFFSGIAKLAAPFSKKVTPGLDTADAALKKAMGSDLGFRPAQATDSHILDVAEGMAEKAWTSGDSIMRHKQLQLEGYDKIKSSVLANFEQYATAGATPEEVGLLFSKNKAFKDSVYRRLASMKYGVVDQMVGKQAVILRPVKQEAERMVTDAAKRKGIGSTDAGDALLKKIAELDDVSTFSDAQAIRHGLMAELNKMSATSDVAKGMAKKFISLVDGAMDDSAKRLSPDAQKAWREANQFYRSYKELFSNDFMRSLDKIAANNPQKVVQSVFKKGAAPQIRQVRSLVSPKTFNELKAGYVREILDATVGADGYVTGKTFLKKLQDMGEPALKEIFTPDELASLRTFGKVGKTLQKPSEGGGGMLIQLWQGGSLAMIAGGGYFDKPGVALGGGAILFGPWVLSKMMTNPTTARYLIRGMKTPNGTKEAMTLATKLAASASKYQVDKAMKEGEPVEYQ